MNSRLSILLLMTLASVHVHAGGPTYSRYGIGDILLYGGPRAFGMGIAGLALSGDGFINEINPAGLAGLTLTRFSGGYEFLTSTVTDQQASEKFQRGAFQGLTVAIPASESDGIVLFGQTSPYSMVDYRSRLRRSLQSVSFTQELQGLGGLSTLSLGASYRLSSDLDIGMTFTYYYGTIQQIVSVDFDDAGFEDSEMRKSLFHSGIGFSIGGIYRGLGAVLGTSRPVSAGFLVSTPSSLSVKEERFLLTSTSADTTLVARGTTELPIRFGIGISASVTDRVVVSGDAFFQQWVSANFFGGTNAGIRNSARFGIGAEVLPPKNPLTYWEAVEYKAGFAYHSSYYSPDGQPVNEWFGSAGVGLPIGPDARLHLAVQAGARGAVSGTLQKESFVRISVSFSASEAWFLTVEED